MLAQEFLQVALMTIKTTDNIIEYLDSRAVCERDVRFFHSFFK